MGYLYLLCVAFLFSFGGTCVRLIKPYFSSEYITCFRFLVGVGFLLLLKLILRRKFPKNFHLILKNSLGWILLGGTAKWLSYLAENYGLSHGVSYGNIITQPAQAVFLTIISVFLFKEKMGMKKVFCIILCIGGVLCVSWNGRPLQEFLGENLFFTLLYTASGFLAGSHILSQKMVADKMDIIDSNLAIFSVSAMLSIGLTAPSTASGALSGITPNAACIFGILLFGFNTGIGFYLNAKAIPLVPFYMVPILQSTMVIFSILWGVLFFHEALTIYMILGTGVFVAGIILLQVLNSSGKAPTTVQKQ